MSEKLSYPPERYCKLLLNLYEQLNGPESMVPMVSYEGCNYDARIWCSRGEVLEKAGLTLMHIRHDEPGGHRIIRHFDTVIHPRNPRVPGCVLLVGQESMKSNGGPRVYCLIDLWRSARQLETRVVDQFREAIRGVCQDHNQSYDELQRSLPGIRLFGGNGCNAGLLFSEFTEADIPFLDQLLECVVEQFARIVRACSVVQPVSEDYQERSEIRREFLIWALTENKGNQRAVAAGVPWDVFEAFAFPPEVSF